MNEEYQAMSRRSAELGMLTSKELGDMLTAAGWMLTNPERKRKQDKVQALLHIEGNRILPDILERLGLVKLDSW